MSGTTLGIEARNLHFAYAKPAGSSASSAARAARARGNAPVVVDSAAGEVLRGVSFDVPAGQITGLLGPNGSGKSTTFKILSTQIEASQGDATVAGFSLRTQREQVRAQLGVTFQAPSLDPMLSIEENLRVHAALVGLAPALARSRIDDLLARFRLDDRRDERVKTLSGGLARRAELAKSLLARPRLLLLDEPTAGLDPLARREFWQLLRSFCRDGMTLLVTTHLMDEAELCDQLVFINEGQIAGAGTPAALKSEFGADIFLVELDGTLAPADALTWLTQLSAHEVAVEGNGLFRIETSRSPEVLTRLQPQVGAAIRGLQWGRPTLADVYFRKTGRALT